MKEAKREEAKAKSKTYQEIYDELGTKERERKVYKISKYRSKKTKDIVVVKVVKDENVTILCEKIR